MVLFDGRKLEENGGIGFIEQSIAQARTTYVLDKVLNSQTAGTKKFYRYKQYYNGIEIEGRGYTIIVDDGVPNEGGYFRPTGTGPGPGPGPIACAEVAGMVPSIFTIDNSKSLDASPSLTLQSARVAFSSKYTLTSAFKAELTFTFVNGDPCTPKLAYKAYVSKNSENYLVYLDANTGSLIKESAGDLHIEAPTLTYGTGPDNLVLLDDALRIDNIRWLVSGDGRVRTHDIMNLADLNLVPADYVPGLIPTTNFNTTVWSTESVPHVYQSHFVATESVRLFQELGVVFNQVFVGAGSAGGANALTLSNPQTDSYLNLGFINSSSTALFDVVGHELGHCILSPIIGGVFDTETLTLQEGLADIFGVYIESLNNGGALDWVMGNDETGVANGVGRDLANRQEECFTDVAGLTLQNDGLGGMYTRAGPLTHWFYSLVTGGDPIDNILNPIDINTLMPVILDAIALLDLDSDYEEFRDAMFVAADLTFGACSDEYVSIIRAFQSICVETEEPCYFIRGQRLVCDDASTIIFCADEGFDDTFYRWTFPINWTVVGSQGNSYNGRCLTVTDIPQYSAYPVTFTVELYSPQFGSSFKQKARITIMDCNDDNPRGCEKGVSPNQVFEDEKVNNNLQTFAKPDKAGECVDCSSTIYNLVGQAVFSGSLSDYYAELSGRLITGVYIVVTRDRSGKFVSSNKVLIQ